MQQVSLKYSIKKWVKHKAHVIYKGHGYEEKKAVYEYVKTHLEMTDYSLKMFKNMADKLWQILPHESNPSYLNQKKQLEEILNAIP